MKSKIFSEILSEVTPEIESKVEQKTNQIMKPQFKHEEIYIDLSKLSEEQQERVMCITGITIEWIKYAGYLIYHKGWMTSNKSWLKDQNLKQLTYSQFLDMMGESEEKSKAIENSEKEQINSDGTLYIGEGLENYYKDQLERTGKFKVVSITSKSEEVLQVENKISIDELTKLCNEYNISNLKISNLKRDLEYKDSWREESFAIQEIKKEISMYEKLKENSKSKLQEIGIKF